MMVLMLTLWLSLRVTVVEPGRADAHDAGLASVFWGGRAWPS